MNRDDLLNRARNLDVRAENLESWVAFYKNHPRRQAEYQSLADGYRKQAADLRAEAGHDA